MVPHCDDGCCISPSRFSRVDRFARRSIAGVIGLVVLILAIAGWYLFLQPRPAHAESVCERPVWIEGAGPSCTGSTGTTMVGAPIPSPMFADDGIEVTEDGIVIDNSPNRPLRHQIPATCAMEGATIVCRPSVVISLPHKSLPVPKLKPWTDALLEEECGIENTTDKLVRGICEIIDSNDTELACGVEEGTRIQLRSIVLRACIRNKFGDNDS